MGWKIDIEESLKDLHITKIEGQPNNRNLMKLPSELLAIAMSIPTGNGGGSHGHMGMLLDDSKYRSFSTGGTAFVVPTNVFRFTEPGLFNVVHGLIRSVLPPTQ